MAGLQGTDQVPHARRTGEALKNFAPGPGEANKDNIPLENAHSKRESPSDIRIDRKGPAQGRERGHDDGPDIDF